MHQTSRTVPAICGSGPFLLVLLLLGATACSQTEGWVEEDPVLEPEPIVVPEEEVAVPGIDQEPAVPEVEEPQHFEGDPFEAAAAETEAESQAATEAEVDRELEDGVDPLDPDGDGMVFSGDPFGDAEPQVGSANPNHQITRESLWVGDGPKSRLVELEAAPEIAYDEEIIQQVSELNLARLRARYLAEVLSDDAKVLVPPGIRTFGEVLPVDFKIRNPLGDPVQLLPAPEGFLLELDWTVERWLPLNGHDRVQRHRYFRLAQGFYLEADQEFYEYAELPLEVEGDQGALWIVEVDARLRCNGAGFEDRLLPVHEIEFQAARFLVLPKGWKQFQNRPLDHLERILTMESEQVDRHVLVCVALLKGDDRYRGLEMLLEGLRNAPNDRRSLSITQSLQWLTGMKLGSLPGDWLRWAEQRKMAATR